MANMDIREHCLGYRDTIRKYFPRLKENGFKFLPKWERIFLEEGTEGLMKEKRGRACKVIRNMKFSTEYISASLTN